MFQSELSIAAFLDAREYLYQWVVCSKYPVGCRASVIMVVPASELMKMSCGAQQIWVAFLPTHFHMKEVPRVAKQPVSPPIAAQADLAAARRTSPPTSPLPAAPEVLALDAASPGAEPDTDRPARVRRVLSVPEVRSQWGQAEILCGTGKDGDCHHAPTSPTGAITRQASPLLLNALPCACRASSSPARTALFVRYHTLPVSCRVQCLGPLT